MAKMYYSESEAAERLGKTPPELVELTRAGELRAYSDGAKRMYKVEEVDALARGASEGTGEIELAPAGDTTADVVPLSEADEPLEAGKDETAITSDGISIFDEEDLEIEAADPMAKTTIAPTVGEQMAAEGVGSGSGLLDLTRESDDTSLGEVLDHIDVEAPIAEEVGEIAAETAAVEAEAVGVAPVVVEEIDASAGAFGGLIAAVCIVMIVLGAVALAAMQGLVPPYLDTLQENLPFVLAGAAIVAVLLAVIGYAIGKSVAARAAALQQMGG